MKSKKHALPTMKERLFFSFVIFFLIIYFFVCARVLFFREPLPSSLFDVGLYEAFLAFEKRPVAEN